MPVRAFVQLDATPVGVDGANAVQLRLLAMYFKVVGPTWTLVNTELLPVPFAAGDTLSALRAAALAACLAVPASKPAIYPTGDWSSFAQADVRSFLSLTNG